MWPSSTFSPMVYVRTGNARSSPHEDRRRTPNRGMNDVRWKARGMAQPFSLHASGVSILTRRSGASSVGLVFLQEALEFGALLFVENLFNPRSAVAEHGAV